MLVERGVEMLPLYRKNRVMHPAFAHRLIDNEVAQTFPCYRTAENAQVDLQRSEVQLGMRCLFASSIPCVTVTSTSTMSGQARL